MDETSKENLNVRTYKDIWNMDKNTQQDLYELVNTSITKRAAREKGSTFSKRDVPLVNAKISSNKSFKKKD